MGLSLLLLAIVGAVAQKEPHRTPSNNTAGLLASHDNITSVGGTWTLDAASSGSSSDKKTEETDYLARLKTGIGGDMTGEGGQACDWAEAGIAISVVNNQTTFTPFTYSTATGQQKNGTFLVEAGDSIRIQANATDASSITATVENVSRGGSMSTVYTGSFCLTRARWLLTRGINADGEYLYPLADFDTWDMPDLSYSAKDGSNLTDASLDRLAMFARNGNFQVLCDFGKSFGGGSDSLVCYHFAHEAPGA